MGEVVVIIVMTSTCSRDHYLVARLNEQLRRHGIPHWLFVEAAERRSFVGLYVPVRGIPIDSVRIKPDGGDNGLGRAGSMNRWHCHQYMRDLVRDDDTFVNIDSDVFFQDERMIEDLICAPGEIKGYSGDMPTATFDGRPFFHVSGMCFAAHGSVFKRAMSIPHDELYQLCTRVDETGLAPSEDVMASLLYQTRGGATNVTNLERKYSRGDGAEFALRHSRT